MGPIDGLLAASEKKGRFVLRPSVIAGLGVYTKVQIPAKEILMEYCGVPLAVNTISKVSSVYIGIYAQKYAQN